MSVLQMKISKASEEFQSHNFKQALQLYEDCLKFAKKMDEPNAVLHNIMSTIGILHSVLGDQRSAMALLNDVMREDPSNYLALLRRSQVYKKNGKFRKAMNDLKEISSFCPDNLQIAAWKIEVQNLLVRSRGNRNSSSESSDSEDSDQEIQLNFANLKLIDRRSSAAPVAKAKLRVTICGDSTVQYAAQDQGIEQTQQKVSGEQAQKKLQVTLAEIQCDEREGVQKESQPVTVKSVKRSTKSILKNKHSQLFINEEKLNEKDIYLRKESKLIQMLKDIDGKVILGSTDSLDPPQAHKEVEFRKSLFSAEDVKIFSICQNEKGKEEQIKKPIARKSCMKRSSFAQNDFNSIEASNGVRRSKFESLPMASIDGMVIRNRKPKEFSKENFKLIDECSYNQESQELSPEPVPNELHVTLFKGGKSTRDVTPPKSEKKRGKSILKKGSVLMSGEAIENIKKSLVIKEENSGEAPCRRQKKSVMFSRSGFGPV